MNSPANWPANRRFIAKQLNYRNPYFPRESPIERKQRHKKVYIISIFIIFAGLVYGLIYSPIFKINQIDVSGGLQSNSDYILKITNDYLNQKIFYFIPRDNWLVLSSQKLTNFLENGLREHLVLDSLTIDKKFKNKLIIKYSEKTATLIAQTTDSYYLIDNAGVIISQYVPIVENNQSILPDYPLIKSDQGENIIIGQNIITQNIAEAILEVKPMFSSRFAEYKISHFITNFRKCIKNSQEVVNDTELSNMTNGSNNNAEVPEEDPIQDEIDCSASNQSLEFALVINDDLNIYFTSTLPVSDQINVLFLTLNEKLNNQITGLKYIDLRFIPRVYYK